MSRKSTTVALTLLGAGAAAFVAACAVSSCEEYSYATTRPNGTVVVYRRPWWRPSIFSFHFGGSSWGGSSWGGSSYSRAPSVPVGPSGLSPGGSAVSGESADAHSSSISRGGFGESAAAHAGS
jgi:hypothetical protein